MAAARQQLGQHPTSSTSITSSSPRGSESTKKKDNAKNNNNAAAAVAAAAVDEVSSNPNKYPRSSNNNNSNVQNTDQSAQLAAHRATTLVSRLTTGTTVEQQEAATTLVEALKQHGEPVRKAAHQAGGTHMLQTLVRSGIPHLQPTCAAALAELLRHSPAVQELTGVRDATSAIIAACLRGIATGQGSYTSLFIVLVSSHASTVKEACAQHKAVRVFGDALSSDSSSCTTTTTAASLQVKQAALAALEALCFSDPGPNLRKLAWGGALPSLIPLVHPPHTDTAASALSLLLLALEHDRRHAEALASSASSIEILAVLIADPDVSLPMQTGAARVLASIASLRTRKTEATQALNDFALPRACEVLRQAEEQWTHGGVRVEGGSEVGLHAACAALIAQLSLGSPLCCHVVLFHAEALRAVVTVLTGCREYGLVEAVLGATKAYAASPQSLM